MTGASTRTGLANTVEGLVEEAAQGPRWGARVPPRRRAIFQSDALLLVLAVRLRSPEPVHQAALDALDQPWVEPASELRRAA